MKRLLDLLGFLGLAILLALFGRIMHDRAAAEPPLLIDGAAR